MNNITGRQEEDMRYDKKLKSVVNHDIVLKFYEYNTRLKVKTNYQYAIRINNFLSSLSKNYLTVNTSDVSDYLNGIGSRFKNPTERRNVYYSLKSFYKFLKKTGKIDYNPIDDIDAPSMRTVDPFTRNDYLNEDEEELTKYVHNFMGYGSIRDKAIIMIFIHTGMRLGELRQLNISDLNFENNSLIVVQKGEKTKVYHGLKEPFEYIKKWMKIRPSIHSDALFVSKIGRLNDTSIRNIVRKYTVNRYEQGMNINKNITPHKLRHTFANMARKSGADIITIQHLMGHTSPATTQRYLHALEDHSADMSKFMDNFTKID